MDHGLPPRRVLPPPVPPPATRDAPWTPETPDIDADQTRHLAPVDGDVALDHGGDDEAPATGTHRVLVTRPTHHRWIPAGLAVVAAAVAAAVLLSGALPAQPAPVSDEAAVTDAAVPDAPVGTPSPTMPAVSTLDLSPGVPGGDGGGPATGAAPRPSGTTEAARTTPPVERPAVVTVPPPRTTPPPVSTPAVTTPPPTVQSPAPEVTDGPVAEPPATAAPTDASPASGPDTD